jgi:hypothetical protein
MIGLWLNGIKPWRPECGKHILEREASNAGTIHEDGRAFHDDSIRLSGWGWRERIKIKIKIKRTPIESYMPMIW